MIFEMIDQRVDVLERLLAMVAVEIDGVDRELADGNVISKLEDPFGAKLAFGVTATEQAVTHKTIICRVSLRFNVESFCLRVYIRNIQIIACCWFITTLFLDFVFIRV